MFDSNQFFSGAKGFYPLTIDQSLRFNDDDSAYLSRTPASAGDRKTWTWSGWVKRGELDADFYMIFTGEQDSTNKTQIYFDNSYRLYLYGATGATIDLLTTQVFRDPSAWYHIVVEVDTTQATASDRAKIYVNGSQVTAFDTETYPTQNTDTYISATVNHAIGVRATQTDFPFDGYLAEVHFTDGTAYDADAFGELKEGVWVAKAPSVTYGTNGFYLDFANSADIGNDISGNANDWTPNNFTASDVVLDSPTDNFATLNPLDATLTLSNGNLDWSAPATVERGSRGTIGVSTGKWYYEYKLSAATGTPFSLIGWASQDQNNNSTMPSGVGVTAWAYYPFDQKTYHNGTASAVYGTSGSANDIIMVALDLDNSRVFWGRNGTWFNSGNPASGANAAYTNVSGTVFPWIQEYNQTSSINFGQLGFTYTPPSGFNALSTANLPDPVIDPAQGASPEDYFNTVLWTGENNSSGRSVTGVGFQPDLVWAKNRNNVANHLLYDSVRGAGSNSELISNSTGAEGASNPDTFDYLSSFDSDGFSSTWSGSNSAFYFNYVGATYVAWNWKANGSGVSNTDGSITSTVSANTESGFSIVGYAGNGSAGATVGHGLSSVPEMIIVKNRDATDAWQVYHASNTANPETDYLVLNTTAATADNLDRWNDTAPTTSVFSLGDGVEVNTNTEDYIAYVFHSVEGFSKFGSYTGNGSADGPFVYTGFRPAFVLIKESSASGQYWTLFDSARDAYNVATLRLNPNDSIAESAYVDTKIDFLSNGFKLRGTYNDTNANGSTYIYMAFAEDGGAFKYSRAR